MGRIKDTEYSWRVRGEPIQIRKIDRPIGKEVDSSDECRVSDMRRRANRQTRSALPGTVPLSTFLAPYGRPTPARSLLSSLSGALRPAIVYRRCVFVIDRAISSFGIIRSSLIPHARTANHGSAAVQFSSLIEATTIIDCSVCGNEKGSMIIVDVLTREREGTRGWKTQKRGVV